MALPGLVATGVCSMIGASIHVVPFMIQRNVPGIGPYVLPAFLFAAIPATLSAFAYIILASAMPRAGGSYVYASRALNPYLGFVASFSQWFGLSIAIGVVSYIIVPFFRDIFIMLGFEQFGLLLNSGWLRVSLALLFLWTFVLINIRGIKLYEKTIIPLMLLMFGFGLIVIVAGLIFNQNDFAEAVMKKDGHSITTIPNTFSWPTFLSASALLFSSFIGFDSIAQAGGEAINPQRNLPRAIGLSIIVVSLFYMLFTFSVYHSVPWSFVAQQSLNKDVTAPGLLSYLLPDWLSVLIVAGAAIALLNDLPSMILSVSRLVFSWAEDGVFPKILSSVHSKFKTPHSAILFSGFMATIGILGSHFAGDFFLGIDIMVTSMMINFLLMCISVIVLPKTNPSIAKEISVIRNRGIQLVLSVSGIILLVGFLSIHIRKDLNADATAWYFHSTFVWIIVMLSASIIFLIYWRQLKQKGIDTKKHFLTLPPE